jgi:(p)ppGpp synthase/HD superfamily hydrolase
MLIPPFESRALPDHRRRPGDCEAWLRAILGRVPTTPEFIAGREPVERAWEYAEGIYSGPGLEEGAGIDHPIAVAELVAAAGFEDDVVVTALLHDIVEDSTATPDEIASRFGSDVAEWVAILSEDISIADYHDRKEEHRNRVLDGGSVTASIYLADKLARTRAFLAGDGRAEPDRLEHYWDTLELFAGRRPELPFLAELADELPQLRPAERTA